MKSFPKVSATDWTNLVKKQLKTDDIDAVLRKENLEGITVKPYYDTVSHPVPNLPKIEESTHLVAKFSGNADENVFAFLIDHPLSDYGDKTYFIENKDLAKSVEIPDGAKIFSLVDCFDENAATFDRSSSEQLLSKKFVRGVTVDISFVQNCGASIVQQLAVMLAKTKELVEEFGAEILDKIIVRTALGANYFFEMAKLRAIKLLYIELAKEYGAAKIPYIFAETSQRNKAVNDPENNIIRATLECAAAMIGGADAVFCHDFRLQNSSELSSEISFKQLIVLAYESIINVFEDAANGSYCVEDFTQQFAEKAWEKFLEIEDAGGFLAELKSGKLQKEILAHAVAEQNWVAEGKLKMIGVNLYPKLEQKFAPEELYSDKELRTVRWSQMYE